VDAVWSGDGRIRYGRGDINAARLRFRAALAALTSSDDANAARTLVSVPPAALMSSPL
jgi:hypothetical protein